MTTSGIETHQHADLEKRLQQVEAYVQEKKAGEAKAAQDQKEREAKERKAYPIKEKISVLKVLLETEREGNHSYDDKCTAVEDVKQLNINTKNMIESSLGTHGVIKYLEEKEKGNLRDILGKYEGELDKIEHPED